MEINPFASFATEKPDIFPLPEGMRERLTRERFLFAVKESARFIWESTSRKFHARARGRENNSPLSKDPASISRPRAGRRRLPRFLSLCRKQMDARESEIIRKRLGARSQLKFSCWPTDSRSASDVNASVSSCKYVNVITGLPRGRHRRSRAIASMSLAEELRFLV